MNRQNGALAPIAHIPPLIEVLKLIFENILRKIIQLGLISALIEILTAFSIIILI